eukprot:GDKI01005209.1.p1 GENE.GDKI01005209.1~~GDKI01005209.1.p1  ORF type:complete len:480 (+),score=76.05 GDKI01005209.1:83-1522(+)
MRVPLLAVTLSLCLLCLSSNATRVDDDTSLADVYADDYLAVEDSAASAPEASAVSATNDEETNSHADSDAVGIFSSPHEVEPYGEDADVSHAQVRELQDTGATDPAAGATVTEAPTAAPEAPVTEAPTEAPAANPVTATEAETTTTTTTTVTGIPVTSEDGSYVTNADGTIATIPATTTTTMPVYDWGPEVIPVCNGNNNPTTLAIGDHFRLCMFVALPDGSLAKMNYEVTVDKYSAIVMNGSYARVNATYNNNLNMPTTHDNSTIQQELTRKKTMIANNPAYGWVSIDTKDARPVNCGNSTDMDTRQKFVSCPTQWVASAGTMIAPFNNLVINMRKGKISSLTWDNQCFTCIADSPTCLKSARQLSLFQKGWFEGEERISSQSGMCGLPPEQCSGSSCEFKVYLTWAGSDKNGNYAMSSGLRFTRFSGETIGSLFNSAKDAITSPFSDWGSSGNWSSYNPFSSSAGSSGNNGNTTTSP